MIDTIKVFRLGSSWETRSRVMGPSALKKMTPRRIRSLPIATIKPHRNESCQVQPRSLLTKSAVATPNGMQMATLPLSCRFHTKSNKDFLALPHAVLIWQYRELLSTRLAHPIAPAKRLDPLDIYCSKNDRRVEASGM